MAASVLGCGAERTSERNSDESSVPTSCPECHTAVYFDSVADMVADEGLVVGARCQTLGYYVPGDGGANTYEIVPAGSGIDDGGAWIDLPAIQAQAKGLFPDHQVRITQFGCQPAAIDSTTAFQAAVDYAAATTGVLDVDVDTHASHIVLPSGFRLESRSRRTIYHDFVTQPDTTLIYAHDASYISVSNLVLDGSLVSDENESFLFRTLLVNHLTVEQVEVRNSSKSGLKITGAGTTAARDVKIIDCFINRVGRAATPNRNGIDLFRVENALIDRCYVLGSGHTPNNVSIMLMGCRYVTVSNCILEDNGSEQLQVIGTDWQTEVAVDGPADYKRTRFVNIEGCVFRHVSGYSNTSNITVGPNADTINVVNCDFSGAYGPGVLITSYSRDINITNCSIHDNRGTGITIGKESYGWATITNTRIFRNGESGISIGGDATHVTRSVYVGASQIYDNGTLAGMNKGIEFVGDVDDVIIEGTRVTDTGAGVQNYAIDTTGIGPAAFQNVKIHGNAFRGNVDGGWRNPLRAATFCWDNEEDDSRNPEFARVVTDYSVAANGSFAKTFLEGQESGVLSHVIVPDASGGDGAVSLSVGLSAAGRYQYILTETKGSAAAGKVLTYAKP